MLGLRQCLAPLQCTDQQVGPKCMHMLALATEDQLKAIPSQPGMTAEIEQELLTLGTILGSMAQPALTYKSRHEALDAWALDELIGHYVNYRKLNNVPTVATESEQVDSSSSRLPPESDFQLYAVATRHPKGLCCQADCQPTGLDGVFNLCWGLHNIRLIVLNDIAKHERNAPWELFSADIERVKHGAQHYQGYRPEAERLLYELYLCYKLEMPDMPYTMADFMRESFEHIMDDMTDEQRLAFLERISPEERLRGLSAKDRRRLKELLNQQER